jgi:hypothetical protein
MVATNAICQVEGGLFRKKPCGHAAVAECLNCQQPLCSQHAIPQLTDLGKRSGKFLCEECTAAAKDQAKTLAAVARTQEEKKKAAMGKAAMEAAVKGAPPKKPVAPVLAAEAKAAEPAHKESGDALEFTPKDGDLSYKTKKDEPGSKGG